MCLPTIGRRQAGLSVGRQIQVPSPAQDLNIFYKK